ncbi:MAG: hypothetical protein ACI8Y4_000977 [Candidatus Poriferisodalaceae bacterium]
MFVGTSSFIRRDPAKQRVRTRLKARKPLTSRRELLRAVCFVSGQAGGSVPPGPSLDVGGCRPDPGLGYLRLSGRVAVALLLSAVLLVWLPRHNGSAFRRSLGP